MAGIWEIIPKISSPLAALSFAVYIFYLVKQSSDQKKASSLKVKDPTAQRSAAELILRDYPDIKVETIKDPKHALELAKQIIHDKIERYHKTLNFLLFFFSIFAITFLISIALNGHQGIFGLASASEPKSFYTWAENHAKAENKPYSLSNVFCHILIEDKMINGVKVRMAYFRYYYTLMALRDITPDEPVFNEQYRTNSATVTPIAGSENQTVGNIKENEYWVKLSAKKNETLSLLTGADYQYKVPLIKDNNAGCFIGLTINDDEWFTCYPNTTDFIDNLTILVEGQNIDISMPPNPVYRKNVQGGVSTADGSYRQYLNNKYTVLGKWSNISPGECIGLKIKWTLPDTLKK